MSWVAVAVAGAAVVGGVIASQGQQSAADTMAGSAENATQLQWAQYQQQRADLAPWTQAGAGAINALWGTPGTPEQTIQGAPIYGPAGGTGTGAGAENQGGSWGIEMQYDWESNSMKPVTVHYPPGESTASAAIGGQQQVITGYQPSTTIPATPGTTGMIQAGPGQFKESPSYQFVLGEGQKGIQRAASATGRLGSGAYLKDATKYAEGLASTEYDNFLRRYYESLNPYLALAGMGQLSATNTANAAGQYGQSVGQNALYAGQANAAGQLGQANTWANVANWGGQQAGNYLAYNQLQNGQYSGVNSPNYGYMNPNQINAMTWL
jgi:hypothetical protein